MSPFRYRTTYHTQLILVLLKNVGRTNIFKFIAEGSYELSFYGTCLTVCIVYCIFCFEVIRHYPYAIYLVEDCHVYVSIY